MISPGNKKKLFATTSDGFCNIYFSNTINDRVNTIVCSIVGETVGLPAAAIKRLKVTGNPRKTRKNGFKAGYEITVLCVEKEREGISIERM